MKPIGNNYWLVKFAPFRTSWIDIVRRGIFTLRGVRNSQARNNIAAMRLRDKVLFYHSQSELAVVGLCEVEKTAFPDPSSADPKWLSVSLKPIKTLESPVLLALIKKTPGLEQIGLIRQPRLAVMPLTEQEFTRILSLS